MTNFFSLASNDTVRLTDGTNTAKITPLGEIGISPDSFEVDVVSFAEQTTGTATTIKTVAAGKVLYILGVQHTAYDYGNSRKNTGKIIAKGKVLSNCGMSSYSSTGGCSATACFTNFSNFPIKLVAGETIQHQTLTNSYGYHSGSIFFVEVDA